MNNLGTLYVYELRKILSRKMVWVVGGILLLLCVFLSLSDLVSSAVSYGDENISGYEMMKINRKYARALSGRVIDDTLLQEMQDFYQGDTRTYNMKEYTPIYSYVQKLAEDSSLTLTIDSRELYEKRKSLISQNRADQSLTQEELEEWKKKDIQVETPFTYEYTDGWSNLWEYAYTINYMLLLMLAICLSGVFSAEHQRKTDAIILCSKYGKKELYSAKMLAGITFGAVTALVLFGVTAVSSIMIYGPDGFGGALQIAFPLSSWKISVGESVVILLFLLLLVSVVYSAGILFLSELLKNSVAVMAVPVGIMVLTMMVDIPYQFRTASQLYDLLPTNLLVKWELWDDRLVSVFGNYLTNFQIIPWVYLMAVVLVFAAGKRVYQKYQVGAR